MAEQQQQQSPKTTPASSSNGNANGGGAQNGASWTAALPEDLRGLPNLNRYKNLETFTRSFLGLEKKLGGTVAIPGAEATDEERAEFYSKLGRPESADKYDITIPENVPVDEKFVNAARETFHKLGLSNQQAKEMAQFYTGQIAEAMQAESAKLAEGVETLKQEWGHGYDRNVAVAQRAIAQLSEDIPGLGEALDDPRFGASPALIRLFAFLGEAMGEDEALRGETGPSEEESKELRDRIDKRRQDPKDPYNDASHPGHKKAVEEMRQMYEQLNGEG